MENLAASLEDTRLCISYCDGRVVERNLLERVNALLPLIERLVESDSVFESLSDHQKRQAIKSFSAIDLRCQYFLYEALKQAELLVAVSENRLTLVQIGFPELLDDENG